MHTRRKRKRKARLLSGGTSKPNTTALSVSGAYILLSQKGRDKQLGKERKKLATLETDLSAVSASLEACNDPNWLDKFKKAKGKNVAAELPRYTAQLEKRKAYLLAEKQLTLQRIRNLDPSIPSRVLTTLATPFVDLRGAHYQHIVGPKENTEIALRK
jgi:hypothetical protein